MSLLDQHTFAFRRAKRTEVAEQADVVAFHSDTRRDEHRPEYGFRIQPDPLEQAHLVLLVYPVSVVGKVTNR